MPNATGGEYKFLLIYLGFSMRRCQAVTSKNLQCKLDTKHKVMFSCNDELMLEFYTCFKHQHNFKPASDQKGLIKHSIIPWSVKNNANNIRFIENITEDIALNAVGNSAGALKYITSKYQTEIICFKAVSNNIYSFLYVEEKTEKICSIAIKKDPWLLKIIKKPSDKMIKLSSTLMKKENKTYKLDEDGWLYDLSYWNGGFVEECAKKENVELTTEHWVIIFIVREYYEEWQYYPPIRVLLKVIRDYLGREKGNSKFIYHLFPDGYSKQVIRYAGMPKRSGGYI